MTQQRTPWILGWTSIFGLSWVSLSKGAVPVLALLVKVAIYYGAILMAQHGGKLIEKVFDSIFMTNTSTIVVSSKNSREGTAPGPITGKAQGFHEDGKAATDEVSIRVNHPKFVRNADGRWTLAPATAAELEQGWKKQVRVK